MLHFMHTCSPVENNKSSQVVIYWLMCFPEVEYKVGVKKKEKKKCDLV